LKLDFSVAHNRWAILLVCVLCQWSGLARAQMPATESGDPSISQWLLRLHSAASQRAYVGTFVVTAGNSMSSARIWHVCDAQQQIERVEALTGEARTTFRRNDQVVTFFPERRVVLLETRESLGLFPNLLNHADSSIARFYRLSLAGRDRVAGLAVNAVLLQPVDSWRFGYKIWTEQNSGVVVKLQTLDPAQTVLEQAAFSELQLANTVSLAYLSAQMDNTQGYQVQKPALLKTTAEQEGWLFKAPVAGFKLMSCHKRVNGPPGNLTDDALQCVFSDGLASVSLFIENFDAARHPLPFSHEQLSMGATHMHTRRLGAWWLTAVGEVPAPTLVVLANSLERKK
jgi:sigma-E factor negative regulatory protein RseB